jgi:hypothetical protein
MTTRKEAAGELRDILAEIGKGKHVMPSKITVGKWFDQWLDGLRLAPSTRASYAKNIRLHIKPKLGNAQLALLSTSKINALCANWKRVDGRTTERVLRCPLGRCVTSTRS